jgi:uncharacterized protein (DUF1919 family)
MNPKNFPRRFNRPHVDALRRRTKDLYRSAQERQKLNNTDFSIISNNCLGGAIYQRFGLQYTSPTIGAFFTTDDYLKFLRNLQHYLAQPLRFIKVSTHAEVNELRAKTKLYPIGLIDDVEVNFLHYRSEEEAELKWTRRITRVNLDNLFVVYCDSGYPSTKEDGFLGSFEEVPFERKVFFSSQPRHSTSVVNITRYSGEDFTKDMINNRIYDRYFDIAAWLNTGNLKRSVKPENR